MEPSVHYGLGWKCLSKAHKVPGERELKGEGEDFSLHFQVADPHGRELKAGP